MLFTNQRYPQDVFVDGGPLGVIHVKFRMSDDLDRDGKTTTW
jgi:hypothetical protein